jgi:hypothetical protein
MVHSEFGEDLAKDNTSILAAQLIIFVKARLHPEACLRHAVLQVAN